jgi:preprotein translocase subunit SecF
MNRKNFNFPFIKYTSLWLLLSLAVVVFTFSYAGWRWLRTGSFFNLGIDFTGGTTLTIRFEKLDQINSLEPARRSRERTEFLNGVRGIFAKSGFSKAELQISDKDLMVRLHPIKVEEREKILVGLKEEFKSVELVESDTIGPTIGHELQRQAIWMIILVLLAITVYVSFRFEFWYGVASIVALFHDALVTLGFASLLNIEINIPFVAAIATILGYSINDTIVIFDRIRENVKTMRREPFAKICDLSINQTLARSINTVLTTELTIIALLIFGGATIKDFTLTLFIGITSGCYSSIFNATPLLVIFKKWSGGK